MFSGEIPTVDEELRTLGQVLADAAQMQPAVIAQTVFDSVASVAKKSAFTDDNPYKATKVTKNEQGQIKTETRTWRVVHKSEIVSSIGFQLLVGECCLETDKANSWLDVAGRWGRLLYDLETMSPERLASRLSADTLNQMVGFKPSESLADVDGPSDEELTRIEGQVEEEVF